MPQSRRTAYPDNICFVAALLSCRCDNAKPRTFSVVVYKVRKTAFTLAYSMCRIPCSCFEQGRSTCPSSFVDRYANCVEMSTTPRPRDSHFYPKTRANLNSTIRGLVVCGKDRLPARRTRVKSIPGNTRFVPWTEETRTANAKISTNFMALKMHHCEIRRAIGRYDWYFV